MGPIDASRAGGGGALLLAASALAATPSVDIHSAGPLSDIYIGNDLSCQVRSGGFSSTEFFPNASGPGDCGTFFIIGSDTATQDLRSRLRESRRWYAHDRFANEVPFTPVSQSLTGSGTAASPYEVTPGHVPTRSEWKPDDSASDPSRHLCRWQ